MKPIFSLFAICSLLTACASTPSQPQEQVKASDEPPLGALLSAKIDTSQTHEIGPIACPHKIADATFEDVTNYDPNATNVSCSYQGDGVFYTLYAYDRNGVTLRDELQGVVNAVLIGKKDWRLTYDHSVSNACTFQGLLFEVVRPKSQGSDVTIDPDSPIGEANDYDLAMGVLTNDKIISIAAVHTRGDMLFKVRATRSYPDGFSEADAVNECGIVAQAMRALDSSFDRSKIKSHNQGATQI